MERNETLIAEKGARSILSFEKKDPEGVWVKYFRGREMMRTKAGEVLEAPSDPLFASEEAAHEWLDAAAPLD